MKTILVVESGTKAREDLGDMLSLANYQVLTAGNGKEAIEIAQKCLPDLILSAIALPVVDGFGMLYMLRHNPKTEAVPVIFMASKANKNDFRNAMESGADDFIIVPCNNNELLRAVESRFRRIYVIRKNIVAELQQINGPDANVNCEIADIPPMNPDIHNYQKKNIFYQEIPAKHYLYFICNDRVTTYKAYEDGKQMIIGMYNNNVFLGYTALLMDATYKKLAAAMDEKSTSIA